MWTYRCIGCNGDRCGDGGNCYCPDGCLVIFDEVEV